MSYKYRRLLAKKSANPDAPEWRETLPGHILDVVDVANTLVRSWGDVFLASMGLPQRWSGQLLSASLRGAFLHDLGKASHQFQRLVRQGPNPPQALRHEWISLLILLHFEQLDRWLFSEGGDLVRRAALFAAIGHHLQIPDGSAFSQRAGSGDSRITVMTGHPDMTDLLKRASDRLNLRSPVPDLTDLTIDLLDDDPLSETRPWLLEANRWWENASPDDSRFVALVKALVIAADLAGSSLPRKGIEAATWVKDVLTRTCVQEELKRIGMSRLNGKPLRLFQSKVAETSSRLTLVRAGCGSGKTSAAYLWSAQKASGRKLFFCYPTTGTATEGYKDYVLPDDIDSTLIHSRAEIDLEDHLGMPDCEGEEQVRIEALVAWDVPLIVCTADTVLGLIQNNRRGLFSFPAIANGAFIFDEIHAYDDRMFAALLRFIETFRGVPVLLMTASLPQQRLGVLRDTAVRLGESLSEIEGPQDLENIPRYRLARATEEDAWAKVGQVLSSGGKVLWVANTVERAVSFGKEAVARGFKPLPYHSRYRYCDRVVKHRSVVEAFKKEGPVLAVTTQVCEVSLDLSADLLVSDLASVPALIQRLGRLNRYVTPEQPGRPKMAILLEPQRPFPYDDSDLESARQWLDQLGSKAVSQADLARVFLAMVKDGVDPTMIRSAWLDGGPFSAPAPLREAGATIPVIRAEDAALAKQDRNQVARLSIPMLLGPVKNEITVWQRLGVAKVAPLGRIDYSEDWGATWRD